MAKTRGTGKTARRAAERAEQSDCYCGNKDGNNTILCDAPEGCLGWLHFAAECENLSQPDMDAIDRYVCSGCREARLAVTTYKVFDDDGNEVTGDNEEADSSAQNAVDFESEDERYSEYDNEIGEVSDSGDSADSDSEENQVASSVETRKSQATLQPALSFPVKKKKGKVAGSGAKKGVKSSRGSKAG